MNKKEIGEYILQVEYVNNALGGHVWDLQLCHIHGGRKSLGVFERKKDALKEMNYMIKHFKEEVK